MRTCAAIQASDLSSKWIDIYLANTVAMSCAWIDISIKELLYLERKDDWGEEAARRR